MFRPLPRVRVRGCSYAVYEAGPADGEPVAFGHGFLMTHRLFERQAEALAAEGYRCLAWDWRGQGASEVTEGGYDPWDLARDAAALLDALGVPRCHYVGFSMGGYAGIRLALLRPDLLATLTLAGTSPAAARGRKRLQYELLLAALGVVGYGPIVPRVLPILFGRPFLDDPARRGEVERWRAIVMANDRTGILRAGRGIFRRDDVTERLGEIAVPVLLLAGREEVVHTVAEHEETARRLPNARVVPIPRSGHSVPVEEPDAVTKALHEFLRAHPIEHA